MRPSFARRKSLAVALIAVFTIAACGSSSITGNPTSHDEPTNSKSPSEALGEDGPPVANPVDIERFGQDLCELLTSMQRQQLGVPGSGAATIEPEGPHCTWQLQDARAGFRISATLITKKDGTGGLGSFYRARSNYMDFEPLDEINGFPAVIANILANERSQGSCAVEVGLSKDSVLDVGMTVYEQNPNYANSCNVAKTVADALTETVRKKAG